MFRVSLRQLFALVACCALALASLKLASNAWLMAVLAVAILAMCTAIIFIAADRGHRQAFSLAFALVVIAYGWIVVNLPKHMPNQQFGGSSEFELWGSQLPTTRLLRHAYGSVSHEYWINSSTGLEIPNFDPSNPSIPLGPGGGNAGGGGGFGGGGGGGLTPTPAGPVAIHDVTPHSEDFARIGHLWWALLFGYIGGRIASRVYRRQATTEK